MILARCFVNLVLLDETYEEDHVFVYFKILSPLRLVSFEVGRSLICNRVANNTIEASSEKRSVHHGYLTSAFAVESSSATVNTINDESFVATDSKSL